MNKTADISSNAYKAIIDAQKSAGNVEFVSVYYRDLNNGPWIGINEKEEFYPASLMKIPVLFYFYKKSETDPNILSTKVDGKNIPQVISFSQHFPPEQSIDPKKTYTVDELINSMITYSDNAAANNLVSIMEPSGINDVLNDLYIDTPKNATDNYMQVKDYATFFRVLYNASYLNRANSEKALRLISETKFDQGIKRYIPKDIVVADKFGERELDEPNSNQVHDCGVVYYPNRPYLLCVMTRGKDIDVMTNTIALISQKVFQSVAGI